MKTLIILAIAILGCVNAMGQQTVGEPEIEKIRFAFQKL